jgi:cytochrome c oxidase subunit 1
VDIVAFWNLIATIGAFIMAFAVLVFVINMISSLRNGSIAGDDPFNLYMEDMEYISPI